MPDSAPAPRLSPLSILIAGLQAMRPKQWSKNIAVLPAAIIFSMHFTDLADWVLLGKGIVAFSLVSSSGYLFNDARDVEADRRHPTKCRRPIASGRLPLAVAYAEMVIIFLLGCLIAWTVSPAFLAVTLLYFATTLSYSLFFKNFVILDVMFISMGFLWRAAAGAVAIDVSISPWLLMCAGFLALFLGFNKRRGELAVIEGEIGVTRKNLSQYSQTLVMELQAITTSGTIISYALYTVLASPTPWLLLTLPHVLYGVFRYIYLVAQRGEGGAPDETFYKDKPILLTCLLYGLTVVIVLMVAPLRVHPAP